MLNVSKEELLNRIEALETRLDQLLGRPKGPISLTEYRIACETGDRATMRRFLEQEEKGGFGSNSLSKTAGDTISGRVSTGPAPTL